MKRITLAVVVALGTACGQGISQNPTGSSSGSASSGGTSGAGSSGSSGAGGSSGASSGSLVGTWDLTTTPIGASATSSTIVLDQDRLTITSPSFSFTATRLSNVLSFNDTEDATHDGSVAATQTGATFNAGIIPFNLGGTWVVQETENGGPSGISCTVSVTGPEIDASCQYLAPTSPWFSFTTTRSMTADSTFGDFGGSWTNHWTWGAPDAGSDPCGLSFFGSGITTSSAAGFAGYPDGGSNAPANGGNPLTGITFTYDGVDTVSGSIDGTAEFSGTRR